MTDGKNAEKGQAGMTLEEAKGLLQKQRDEDLRMCGAEIAAVLEKYKCSMQPKMLMVGGQIVEHGIVIAPKS
ncbi:MAG: hypothetical protein AB9866_21720 [Syntrophobacteraceae bacterium]